MSEGSEQGVHSTDNWKQDASLTKLEEVKVADFFHFTNQQNSHATKMLLYEMRFESIKCIEMRLRPGVRSGPRWRACSAAGTRS